MRAGYPEEDVAVEAAKTVAVPGTSEHELGLALDIVDSSYPELETEQENTPVQRWLMKNSWKYGFVLRYPSDKSALTGIIYEPWHYRYVGKEAAKVMYEEELCLEEYLEKYCS
ncbi:MAG: M15 family metallopeptidase [Lacrimispora saccharolytica]